MSTLLKSIRQPLGTILPSSEVNRRVIVDALDKCGGNYLLAAHRLGIGRTTIYRMGRMYRNQQPRIQAERLMSMSQCKSSVDAREPKGEHMRTNDTMNVGE
jgi:transposase